MEQPLSEENNDPSVIGEVRASLDDNNNVVDALPLTMSPTLQALPPTLQPDHEPPAISDAELFRLPPGFQSLDQRWITVDRIASWIVFGVVAGCAGVGLIVYIAVTWPPGVLVGLVALAALLALALLAWACHSLPVISYRHAGWQLDEKGLELRRGILWRHEITIPLARVQHTDVHQGPLLRQYGLAKLIIHTAGTENASVEMEGLALETAHRLRDALVAQCEARHVN